MLKNKAKSELIQMYVSLDRERNKLKERQQKANDVLEQLGKIATNIFSLILNIRVTYRLIKELIKIFRR